MNKELLLLRHGKSSWDVDCDDFDRPLVERGKRGAELLGVWLQQQQLLPDFILSSPAVRAIETAKKCCKAMGFSERHIYQDERIYEANAATLKEIINDCPPQAQRIMLVGHNPGLEHLLQDLLHRPVPESENGKLLPTSTLAHLTLAEHWSQTRSSCGQLNSITCASSLEQHFPFVSLTGTELRVRPAYYYTQSAVIPYRIENGKLQLLLIFANGKQKWGFPKGIVEPGLTPQASAAKEAYAEVGLTGVVADQALGSYKREKWQGQCSIQVFPMRVTDMTNSHEQEGTQWQWFSANDAISKLEHPALEKMIKKLSAALDSGDLTVAEE